ncbi:unnamed protein product [Paramecium octaurelia]|uniref:Uncharacterized protein n=1 Tax=Paramecium octaurelia TaxID=43137 RepID=A0A8S1YLK5_PAROT|nr:unnamed protein product [Paramecium octaurelia]
MSSSSQKKICSIHKLEITTIDLSKSIMNQNKYLCTKCLIQKISTKNMVLVNEAEEMIKEMENTQKSIKHQEVLQRVENYRLIQQLLRKCQEQFLTVIEQIILNLEDKIQSINEELQQFSSKQNEQNFEDKIDLLSQNYQGNHFYKAAQQFKLIEYENQFFNTIKSQLLSFNNNQSYTQLMNSLSETIIDEKIKDEAVQKIQSIQTVENDQTPSLNIKCNKHGKKIILLNLDTNQTSHSRKVCIDCICENDPIYYTSLHEAEKRWKEYQVQTQISIKEYINHKKFQQQQILIILDDIKDKYTTYLHEQINKLKSLESKLNKLENDNIMEDSIYDLDEDQIDEIVRTLSQIDLDTVLVEQQNNQQVQDQILYQTIAKDIYKHIHYDLQASKAIVNISKSDSSQQQSCINYQLSQITNPQKPQQITKHIQRTKKKNYLQMKIFLILMNTFAKFKPNSAQLKKIDQIEKELKSKQLELEQIQFEKKTADQNQKQKLMELKKISDGYAEEIVNLKIQKQEIQENLNQNKSKTDSKIQILEQQLKELKEKIEEGERSKIENFQKFLQYSNIYKSNNCSISDGGKIAECGSNPGFCICEQMIPKFGITKFAFQVIEKSGWLFFAAQQFKLIEYENQFFNTIKSQLLSFNNNQSYTQLMNSLSETIIDEKIKDEAVQKIQSIQTVENDQTPSLNIKCNKHGKKIILLNLDTNQTSHSRKVCIDCICENDPIYYTSLHEAEKRWKEYQVQTQISIKEYINHKKFQQQQILIILDDIKDKYTTYLHEQINKLKSLESKLNKLENDNIMEDSIYDLDEDQIDEIVRTLSQIDLDTVLVEQQNNQQVQDQILYQTIAKDIYKHIHYDLQASKAIVNISKSDSSQQQSYEDFSDFDEYICKIQTQLCIIEKNRLN